MADTKTAALEESKVADTSTDELVERTIPYDDSGKKSNHVRLSLNGRVLRLERGLTHLIPKPYADMLDQKIAFRKQARRYEEKVSKQ